MMVSGVGIIVVLIGVSLAILGLIVGVKLVCMIFAPSTRPQPVHTDHGHTTPRPRTSGRGSLALLAMVLPIGLIVAALFAIRTERAAVMDARMMAETQRAHAQQLEARARAEASRIQAQDRIDPGAAAESESAVKPDEEQDQAAEDKSYIRSQFSSILRTIERSDVPLMPVETLKLIEQVGTALYADQQDATVLTTTTPPEVAPEWIKESAADANLHVVVSQPRASENAATEEALELANELVMEDYRKHMVGVGNWSTTLDRLSVSAVQRRYTEALTWDFTAANAEAARTSENGERVYRTYMLVRTGPALRAEIYSRWKHDVQSRRFEAIGILFIGLIAVVASVAGYYRLDDRTRGRWRWPLRLASAAVVCMIAVAVVDGSGHELMRAIHNHVGPASEHGHTPVQEAQPYYHIETSAIVPAVNQRLPVSEFATLPIHARRVAFVVLGDGHFAEANKIQHVNDEIIRCLNGFRDIEFKLVCQSSEGPIIAGGQIRNGRVRNGGLRNVKRALDRCFTAKATSVYPTDAVRVATSFRPDAVVVVRDAAAEIDADKRFEGDAFSQVFTGSNVVVHAVELGDKADHRVNLPKLATRSGGEYVLWTSP